MPSRNKIIVRKRVHAVDRPGCKKVCKKQRIESFFLSGTTLTGALTIFTRTIGKRLQNSFKEKEREKTYVMHRQDMIRFFVRVVRMAKK